MKKYTGFAALVLCVFTACSSSKSSDSSSPDPKVLVQADIAALAQVDVEKLRAFDGDQGGLFSAIFGGTDGDALNTYLFTRLHYFYSAGDLGHLRSQPDDFKYKGWRTDVKQQKSMLADEQVGLGAANIGTEIWLNGLIDNVPVTVFDGSKPIPVDSSRVGLMLIGPMYTATITDDSTGAVYQYPAASRQAILLHEARHSDCTGGISAADLAALRGYTSAEETDQRYQNRQCGHLHTYCKTGKLAGVLACDDGPWGAYAVEYIYLRAMLETFPDDRANHVNRAIMQFRIMDARSRLLLDPDGMGTPNMTSEGLR